MLRLIRIFTLLIFMLASGFAIASSVNINTADAATMADALDGIGLAKANAIVDYRNQHGNFSSLDELLQIKGIGEKTLERNRDRISLEMDPEVK